MEREGVRDDSKMRSGGERGRERERDKREGGGMGRGGGVGTR